MLGNVIKKIGVTTVSVIGAAVVGESLFNGAVCLSNDVHTAVNITKQVINPDPVLVKKGMFGKKQVVTYNPVTNKVKPYNGKKNPINKKPVKLAKEYYGMV